MPSIHSFFQKQHQGSSNRSSSPHSAPGAPQNSANPRQISAPIPAASGYSGRQSTISTASGTTIQLVPPSSASVLPHSPSLSTRPGGDSFAADQFNISNGGGGGNSSSSLHDNSNPTAPSSASSSFSQSSARRPNEAPSFATGRKPLNLFSGSRDRDRSSIPLSPPGSGLGRRLSVRHHKQQSSSPLETQPYHLHAQHQGPAPRHITEADSGLDPYLQQTPPPTGLGPENRPRSFLPAPHEKEAIDFALQRGEFVSQPDRHDSFSQASQLSQPFYEPNQEYHHPQQQPHSPQDYTPQPLEGHTAPGPPTQSRPSTDMMRQGTPSREASQLSQHQQPPLTQPQQQYIPQQNTDSHFQNQNAGGQPQGQPHPSYDASKFEDRGTATPDHGRAPSRTGDSTQEAINIQQTLQDFETLQGKYRKVKALYFERNAEIERLQNTLAHQRLAQSRTSLDDNEYTARFERLDGAIKNVSFELRQSWKGIPTWLSSVINADAAAKGGREMTVVGRAYISRWVVDEIIEQFFHPAVDPNLSVELKKVERNIRIYSPPPQSQEEDEALSTKVCNWRLTTLDSLHAEISGQHALGVRSHLAEHLVNRLVSSLQLHLHEPAPPGLLGGVQMVIDIAVALAANLPLESRDVRVWYPLPATRYDGSMMKIEGGLPTLGTSVSGSQELENDNPSNSGDANSADDSHSTKESSSTNPSSRAGVAGLPQNQAQTNTKDQKKTKGLGGRVMKALQGSAPPVQQTPPSPKPTEGGGSTKEGPEKIRVAGFMAVEVRGRSILVKAPVWL